MADAIAVCVATFRRPGQLRTLLDALQSQSSQLEWHVYVIDNDPDRSAEEVARTHTLPVTYRAEPTPGIVAARNAALDIATEPLVAFIDDDEYPGEGWLDALFSCMTKHSADAVWGPVVSVFPADTPEWVRRGGFFSRSRNATGTEFDQAATNNLLVRRSAIDALEYPRFDERFSASGGSDSELFHRAWKNGSRIIWCDEAIVFEDVPHERMTVAWLKKRARRTGNVRGRLLVQDGERARAWIEGAGRVAVGACRLLLDRVRRQPLQSSSLNTWMRGWGVLDAARDRVVIEYRR